MESKHVTFLLLCVALVPIATFASRSSRRIRDFCFMFPIFITTTPDRYDVNVIGREMYRSASRGIEISMLDALLLAVWWSQPQKRRSSAPIGRFLMVAYTLYAALTIPTHDPMIFGTFELSKLVRGLFVFTVAADYVRSQRELRVLVTGLACAMGYVGLVALQDRYILGQHRIHSVLGSWNQLAMYSNFIAPVMVAVSFSQIPPRMRKMCIGVFLLAAVSVILTISRTGFAVLVLSPGLCALVSTGIKITPKKLLGGVLALMLAAGVLYKAKDSLLSRFGESSLEKEAESERGRGMYFRLSALVMADHPLGIGLNNWSYVVTNHYYELMDLPAAKYPDTNVDLRGFTSNQLSHEIAPPAHNLGLLTMGEVGYPGFAVFLAMWIRWMTMGGRYLRKRKRGPDIFSRYGLGCFFAMVSLTLSSLTEYGFRHAAMYFLVHIVLGGLAGSIASQKEERMRFVRERRLEARGAAAEATQVPVPEPSAPTRSY